MWTLRGKGMVILNSQQVHNRGLSFFTEDFSAKRQIVLQIACLLKIFNSLRLGVIN